MRASRKRFTRPKKMQAIRRKPVGDGTATSRYMNSTAGRAAMKEALGVQRHKQANICADCGRWLPWESARFKYHECPDGVENVATHKGKCPVDANLGAVHEGGPTLSSVIIPVIVAIALCLAAPSFMHAQGGSISGMVIQPGPPNGTGGPAPSAAVRVCPYIGGSGTPCSPTANLFLDPGLTIASPNPATSDSFGNYSLWVSPGAYLVQVVPINGFLYSYLVQAVAGTVTSVGLSMPSTVFSVSGSPVTGSGILAVTFLPQSAGLVFASPTNAFGLPTFRNSAPGDFGSQSANTVLGNCTSASASPLFCALTASMIPSTLNSTAFSGQISAPSLVLNSGTPLTTTNQSGTGSIVLTNSPVITTPTIDSCPQLSGVGACSTIQNYSITGTALNTLTKLANTGGVAAVVAASTSDTGGVIGVVIAGAGTSGSASVITSGAAQCQFDGSTTGGDYIQISSTLAGYCHDTGIAPPLFPSSGGQVVGRSAGTFGGAGVYSMLFEPEAQAGGVRTLCASGTLTTVNANTNSVQTIETCPIPAGALNSIGKTFRATFYLQVAPSGTSNSLLYFNMGGSPTLAGGGLLAFQGSSAVSWEISAQATCTTTATGISGAITCAITPTVVGGTASYTILNNVYSGINLTQPLYAGTACLFLTASSSNSCAQSMFSVEQLN
ncbi:MAG TPA: hypothetical protein VN861_03340 [Candidatus Acidoferrales bacterium]|nr:hypothetical protein [Candidatus Acidoferrales bacterium]